MTLSIFLIRLLPVIEECKKTSCDSLQKVDQGSMQVQICRQMGCVYECMGCVDECMGGVYECMGGVDVCMAYVNEGMGCVGTSAHPIHVI